MTQPLRHAAQGPPQLPAGPHRPPAGHLGGVSGAHPGDLLRPVRQAVGHAGRHAAVPSSTGAGLGSVCGAVNVTGASKLARRAARRNTVRTAGPTMGTHRPVVTADSTPSTASTSASMPPAEISAMTTARTRTSRAPREHPGRTPCLPQRPGSACARGARPVPRKSDSQRFREHSGGRFETLVLLCTRRDPPLLRRLRGAGGPTGPPWLHVCAFRRCRPGGRPAVHRHVPEATERGHRCTRPVAVQPGSVR